MNTLKTLQSNKKETSRSFRFIDSAKLAHDLKGPLNSIKGLLVIAGGDVKDKRAQHYFKLIEKYQQLLYTRIDNALNKVKGFDNETDSSGLNFSQVLGGVRFSLKNISEFAGLGFNSFVSQKIPFSEKLYRATTVINIMKALQGAYFDKNSHDLSNSGSIDLVKLAHDIKGPLNSIKGLLDIAYAEVENESARMYFELIGKCQQQLYTRVEETLRRLDRKDNAPKTSKIDFCGMIEEIHSSLAHMEGFSEIEFNIIIDNKRPFYSDADAIYSIIQNLLENAIKYRKHDASLHRVALEISDVGKKIKIQIADNGIGIKEELFSEIFKFKFRDESSPESGHGIGLALVNQLTERLRGDISFESKYGDGSIFTVEIPNQNNY